MSEQDDSRRSADQPVPNTQAPGAGEPPAAGKESPAEKSEPSGVPVQEHRHNADPNAPQTQVTPPGQTQFPPGSSGGVSASSMRQDPEDGTEEARRAAQIVNMPPPPDAGQGHVRQPPDLPGRDARASEELEGSETDDASADD